MPKLKHFGEAFVAYGLYGFFSLLTLDTASALGGWMFRTLGPRLAVSRRADRHIQYAMPELSDAERQTIVRDMWENMGRTMAETPHLKRLVPKNRMQISGLEHVEKAREHGKGAMIAGGHFANWEAGPIIAWHHGFPLTTVYRPPNNPLIDPLLRYTRRVVTPNLLPKGPKAAVGIIKTLRQNGIVALLIDQKMNNGVPLQFFNRPAMTGLTAVQLALKNGSPLMVASCERHNGAYFTLTISEPIKVPDDLDTEAAAMYLMQQVNNHFEALIRKNPGQWLWLHRRWDNRKKTWEN